MNDNQPKIIEFPKNITVSKMKKATFSKLLLNSKRSRIDGFTISDSSKINNFMVPQVFVVYNADLFVTH